ncbi:MAG: hypothetical protein JKX84_02590 [Flavobacteriales bacterium]|nr:hypothetical protein [Flavobacteriales bacterium]
MRITITLSLLLIIAPAFAQNVWDLKKDKDGIKVYTRSVGGSSMKATKAVTILNCDLHTCVAVLKDIDHLKNLFPDCSVSKKIEQSEMEQIHYLELDAPWPVTDRDAAFRLVYRFDSESQSVIVDANPITGKYPEQKGKVRLTTGKGEWRFRQISEQTTEVIYSAHIEPGGSIPMWLANSVVEENPYRMFTNFSELIKLERYRGKKFGFIN